MALWGAKDKTFIITGGASGLGAQYVKSFLSQGAKFVAILDIAEEVGKSFAEELSKIYTGKVTFIKCNVAKEEDIVRAFDEVVNKIKRVDVIINNAGIMVDAENVWRTACDVNWQGLVSFTMKGIKHMGKDEGGVGGTIVNISSIAALVKFAHLPIYSGSKMAVLHFGQSISLPPFNDNTGVRILTICFGPTDTPLLHNLDKRGFNEKAGKILENETKEHGVIYQKVDAAVTAFNHMIKHGGPGSIWLSADNKPAKDITPAIEDAFQKFEHLVYG